MNIVIFYEKRGCTTNKKQKKLLRDAGYILVERDLLQHGLSKHELYSFFENRPIQDWFNPNAPQIKNGYVNPNNLSKKEAINLLFHEPILIKRPLMLINGERICGFEQEKLGSLLDLSFNTSVLNSCSAHHEECSIDKRIVS